MIYTLDYLIMLVLFFSSCLIPLTISSGNRRRLTAITHQAFLCRKTLWRLIISYCSSLLNYKNRTETPALQIAFSVLFLLLWREIDIKLAYGYVLHEFIHAFCACFISSFPAHRFPVKQTVRNTVRVILRKKSFFFTLFLLNCPAADNRVSVVQYDRLSFCDSTLGLVKFDLQRIFVCLQNGCPLFRLAISNLCFQP